MLAPSYQGRILSNQEHGDLVVDEIPGLLEALQLPPIRRAIDVALTDATLRRLTVDLPDVRAALLLKAYAFRDRLAGRDAIDVWRLLESANRAGHTAATWPHGSGWREGAALLHRHFGATGRMVALPDRAVRTRVRALTVRVVPPGPTAV
ncbi:hypothetical protein AGMMS50218_12940 [Actinomycetota bacterium]|nr:hypothetical protein AGMMS50218_12940 [Actinomycetota bacterium]